MTHFGAVHEKRTRTAVSADIGLLPPHVPLAVTISLFRFAQEGLNNAFRHAGGRGQAVKACHEGGVITVEVIDSVEPTLEDVFTLLARQV